MPTAFNITIAETLLLLDGPFAPLASGVARRLYTLWLGSGISRERVDDLRGVIRRVLNYLREHCDPANNACTYFRALDEAINLAQLSPADRATIDYSRPLNEWPPIDTLLRNLTGVYARLLDIRIDGHPDEDHLLWEVVDVPATFAPGSASPDCEHLCIALLILEGVVPDIASANWDGLIEAAVDELTDASGAALRVCVRPGDLQLPPLLTRLLKFHGCAVCAARDPATYRPLLIARHSQITDWQTNVDYAFMRAELQGLAATKRTLMVGLSAQDSNIQNVFAAGRQLINWPWPSDPPAHIFAEDALGVDQLNILRVVYKDTYAANRAAIEGSALFRAFAKPALTAMVLHVLCAKLQTYVSHTNAPGLLPREQASIKNGLKILRDHLAAQAEGDRLAFIRSLITASARLMAFFQTGAPLPAASKAYKPLTPQPEHMIATDPNLATSGVREMASALGLLGLGHGGSWRVDAPDPNDPRSGVLNLVSNNGSTRVFFAANDRAGVQLEINGLVSKDDADAIIIHSTAPVAMMARSPRSAPGRTGKIGLRQVGMTDLLSAAQTAAELQTRFREEASL